MSGATGFIGRSLCQQLQAGGASVIALSHGGRPLDDGSPTLAVDLADTDLAPELLTGVDVVFHLAGIAHRRADEQAYRDLNYQATLRLARLAADRGVGCFVFLSSVKAMGPAAGDRQRSEDDTSPPQDYYGLSKWQAECALREEFADAAMSVVIVRPALVYGARARGNLELLARGVRCGLPRPPPLGARSMLALEDLVDLLCAIGNRPPPGVNTWIACDDEGYSTRFLYDLLRETSGRGRGVGWLPTWAWRLAARLLDLQSRRRDEPLFDKLFGTEVYDNSAACAAMNWHPAGRLAAAAAAMVARP